MSHLPPTVPAMATAALDAFLTGILTTATHPAIAAVTVADDPAAWCRVRVDFTDGSAVYLGVDR